MQRQKLAAATQINPLDALEVVLAAIGILILHARPVPSGHHANLRVKQKQSDKNQETKFFFQ